MKNFIYHENGWRWFEAEQLPSKTYYLHAENAYNKKISALKAKSLPVGNASIKVYENGSGNFALLNGVDEVKLTSVGEHMFEWPGSVEVKEILGPGWVPTYNDPDNSGCHPMAEPEEVAILKLPETKEKDTWNDAIDAVKDMLVVQMEDEENEGLAALQHVYSKLESLKH